MEKHWHQKNEYCEEFERIWRKILPASDASKKQSGYAVYLEMTSMTCPDCGCTEMLCGYNGVGCASEGDK